MHRLAPADSHNARLSGVRRPGDLPEPAEPDAFEWLIGALSTKQLVADGQSAAEPFARHPGKSAEHVVWIRS